MSDTPRTDEAMPDLNFRPYTLDWQRAQQFSRQLERELTEAKRDASRYQIVRRLNKREFAALVDDCLYRDLRFDDEVDKIGGIK